MNFVADESVDRSIVERLRADSHQVHAIAEADPGAPDDIVLARANRERSILITADKDFGELVFRQRRLTSGVILLRLSGLPSDQKAELAIAQIAKYGAELSQAFTVITPRTIRIRRSQA